MNKNSVRLAVALAFGLGSTAVAPFALAQQAGGNDQVLEKIEITGSIIKRAEAEGALPVQVVTHEQIEKLGLVTASDLVQSLPSMQGFTAESSSVNGGGGGVTTASIHDLGAAYTLVLLNGQRLAPTGNGTSINLETLPLSVIDRVEVLKDGASAIYGSDAIAGVVNFITKKNSTDGSVSASFNHPVHGGGESGTFAISKGFGDLDRDGWNIVASFSHDEQTELRSNQRDFSSTGHNRAFSQNGVSYTYNQTSANSVPANVVITDGSGNFLSYFSAYQAKNGACGPNSFKSGATCRFDYSANVEDVAPARRTTGYLDGHFKINETTKGFFDVLLSQYDMIPRYAPPAQPMAFPVGGLLWNKDIVPLINSGSIFNYNTGAALTAADVTAGSTAQMYLRLYDAGGRTDDYGTTNIHLAGGFEGDFHGWDYRATYVHSYTNYTDTTKGGYLDQNQFFNLVNSGAFDPLMNPTSSSDLSSAILRAQIDSQRSFLDTAKIEGSRDLFQLAGGAASLGVGAELGHLRQEDDPSQILQTANFYQPNYSDAILGGGAGNLPYEAARTNYGAFAEMLLPITKTLEATGSLRYDHYGQVKNTISYNGLNSSGFAVPAGAGDQGVAAGKATYKISLRFQPVQQFAARGSYGTGFRVAPISDIASPIAYGGSTAGSYLCPFVNPAHPLANTAANAAINPTLAAGCFPGSATTTYQYDLLSGGNANSDSTGIQPETSKQYTFGFVFEPTRNLSFVADYWDVKITNQISGIPETNGFSNPGTYTNLFHVINDPISQIPTLAFLSAPFNLSESVYRGIDWDVKYGHDLPVVGRLVVEASGTHLLEASYLLPGTGPGTGWQTDLGQFGEDNAVAFKDIVHLAFTLNSGAWTNTLIGNYKSGYKDQSHNLDGVVFVNGTNVDYEGSVAAYTLWDWQTAYRVSKSLELSVGLRNLFDKRPPFSAVNAGGGNQVGYDGRYTDPLLRTIYARFHYSF